MQGDLFCMERKMMTKPNGTGDTGAVGLWEYEGAYIKRREQDSITALQQLCPADEGSNDFTVADDVGTGSAGADGIVDIRGF